MGSAVAKNEFSQLIVRNARRDDMDDVLDLMKEMALLGEVPEAPEHTVEDLIRDGGYNSDTAQPLFVCFVAEKVVGADSNSQTRSIIGYSLCCCQYSGNIGDRVLHMEDLYVRPTHRNQGLGDLLFEYVQKTAVCHPLNWTPHTEFYKRSVENKMSGMSEMSKTTLRQGGYFGDILRT